MASQNKQFAIRTKPESSAEDSEPTKKRERTKKDVVRTVLKYYENLVEEFEDEAICKAETMIENVKGKLAHNQSRDKKSSKPVCQEVMEAFKAHRMARSSKNQAIAYDPSESTREEIPRCPITMMVKRPPLPPMKYWVQTPVSIRGVEHRTFSHIPYMNETVAHNTFGDKLQEMFDGGVHGAIPNHGYINDMIFYQLTKGVLLGNKDYALRDVLLAINEQFPNKGTVDELHKLFFTLKDRHDPDPKPSISVSDQTLEEIAEGTMNDLAKLKCSRCLAFGCVTHKKEGEWNAVGTCPRAEPSPDRPPCENDCHRKASGSSEGELPKVTEEVRKGIAALHSVFREDYCRIAECINASKMVRFTCKQMKRYVALHSSGKNPKPDIEPRSRSPKPPAQTTFRKALMGLGWTHITNKRPYTPCTHDGPCTQDSCSCLKKKNPCTRYCQCPDGCKYRFAGCDCAVGACSNGKCPCVTALWECDAEVCLNCATEKAGSTCKNMKLQRGETKLIAVGPSAVAGWGCYAAEDIKKGDLIGEYKGEYISGADTDRIGTLYDMQMCSYIFAANSKESVDAMRKGTVIRFINHASASRSNCVAKGLTVHADHLIGIFAKEDIDAGEELFYDYGYSKEHQVFVAKELPKEKRKNGKV